MEPLNELLINGGKRGENKMLGQCEATWLNEKLEMQQDKLLSPFYGAYFPEK